MSTIKADTVTTKSDDTDLTITGGGTGVPNLEAGFKVGGSAGVPTASIQDNAVTLAKMAGLTRGSIIHGDSSGDPAALAVGGANTVLQSDGTDSSYGTVATAMIADDAVTLAKMAAGTDGNIISYDASGNPVAIATGNDGQVLTSTGAGSPPAFEDAAGGGAWTLIGSTLASSSASVTITGLDNTYIAFAIVLADIDITTDDGHLFFRFGDSSGIDSGASDYAHYSAKGAENSSTWAGTNETGDSEIHINSALGIGNDDLEYLNCVAYVYRGTTSTSRTAIHGQYTFIQMDGLVQTGVFGGFRQDAIDLTQVQIIPNSGSIDAGRMSVYGIKHT